MYSTRTFRAVGGNLASRCCLMCWNEGGWVLGVGWWAMRWLWNLRLSKSLGWLVLVLSYSLWILRVPVRWGGWRGLWVVEVGSLEKRGLGSWKGGIALILWWGRGVSILKSCCLGSRLWRGMGAMWSRRKRRCYLGILANWEKEKEEGDCFWN